MEVYWFIRFILKHSDFIYAKFMWSMVDTQTTCILCGSKCYLYHPTLNKCKLAFQSTFYMDEYQISD